MTDQQDIEKQAQQLGTRIAWLMAASTLPEDVKEAYITLLPEMSMEQIDLLVQMLEANVAGAAEIEAATFVENLKTIKAKYEEHLKASQGKTLKELEEVEALLNQAQLE